MKYHLMVIAGLMGVLFLQGCGIVPDIPQEVVAETIGTVSQVSNVVTNQVEPWLIGVIILLAGWAIPSPMEMARGLFGFIGGTVKLFKG